MPKCKSCGAEIIWIETGSGKSTPIDAKPEKVYYRNIWKITDGFKWILINGHKSHFATCPDADKWRKGGTGK